MRRYAVWLAWGITTPLPVVVAVVLGSWLKWLSDVWNKRWLRWSWRSWLGG